MAIRPYAPRDTQSLHQFKFNSFTVSVPDIILFQTKASTNGRALDFEFSLVLMTTKMVIMTVTQLSYESFEFGIILKPNPPSSMMRLYSLS